jgi:nitrogen fixation protein FixH
MKALVWIVGIVVVAMTIATIVIGTRTFEGTVVDKPYEAGLAWDADNANRAALGWSVSLDRAEYSVGDNEILVRVLGRDGKPLTGAAVEARLSRPSTSAYDKAYEALPRQEGGYAVKLALPLPGAWDLAITVSLGKEATSFAEKISAK